MKYDIFISYSRKDIGFAREVCAVLDSYKQYYTFEYFFDQSEITSANEYLDRISSAIYESRVVFFIASENSYGSRFCAKELLFADDEGKNIHQYRIDEASMPHKIKMLLGNYQYRELKSTPIDSMVREVLADALGCEISTLEKLVENDNLRRQQEAEQQKIRVAVSALENRCFEIQVEILSYEKKVVELNREKSNVERQISDLRNKIVRYDNTPIRGNSVTTSKPKNQSVDSKVYKVGDYYDDGTRQGVVFEVSEDGTHGKIVSLKQADLEWCTKKQYDKNILVGVNSRNDGEVNTDIVMRRSDYAEYPAFKWCREQGKEWYLPSRDELQAICNVQDYVNKTLIKYSHQEIIGPYWSSTETGKFRAWYVLWYDGGTSNLPKLNAFSVRAVSAF